MEELDLKELLIMFWEKRAQILLIILIMIVLGIGYSYLLVKPKYKSKTKLVLTQSVANAEAITQADITLNSKLVPTYGEIIKTDNILSAVVENIDNPEININNIKNSVTVQSVKNTELIEIIVTNSNPNYAATIANEIAKVFCERVVEIYNISNTYILDRAKPDGTPYNVNHAKDIIIFIFVGIVVAAAYTMILNLLDNTIKSEQDIEKVTGLITLTNIPDYTIEHRRGGRKK